MEEKFVGQETVTRNPPSVGRRKNEPVCPSLAQ
jgi:hypothetical protein